MRASRFLSAIMLAAFTVAGCGYSFRGSLPPTIKTVAIPVFANKSQEPNVESFVTQAVVEAFMNSGRLRVVPVAQADSVLEGEIVEYRIDSLTYDRQANVTEYRLWITLNLTLRDVKGNATLYKEDGVQEKADFRIPGQRDVRLTILQEEEAAKRAAVDIGRSIVNRAVERF